MGVLRWAKMKQRTWTWIIIWPKTFTLNWTSCEMKHCAEGFLNWRRTYTVRGILIFLKLKDEFNVFFIFVFFENVRTWNTKICVVLLRCGFPHFDNNYQKFYMKNISANKTNITQLWLSILPLSFPLTFAIRLYSHWITERCFIVWWSVCLCDEADSPTRRESSRIIVYTCRAWLLHFVSWKSKVARHPIHRTEFLRSRRVGA